MTKAADRAVAAKFIESRYGKLDILVNNADVGPADGLIGLRASESIRLSQITPDALDHWKSSWPPKAKNPDDRIGKMTAGRRLEKIKRFLNYGVKMRWLATKPAAELKAIKPHPRVTWPLLSGRYEKLIAAPFGYDKRARRPSDQFGAELRAIIELMRTGPADSRCPHVRQIEDSGELFQSHKPDGQNQP